MSKPAIRPGFQDIPGESQTVFRAVMNAMARPGTIHEIDAHFTPPAPLNPAAAAILLTLADFETAVWLDTALSEGNGAADFLRFHTGAKFNAAPEEANFALISDPASVPPLASFAQGTPDFPDRSTTLVIQVSLLSRDGWRLTGPGIDGETALGAWPLPPGFDDQLRDNHSLFPLGVDVIFAAPERIAALPRSTRIEETR
jgi:alpha-D-ribose 1-methylphosphonate 5-triphosphate synthase subunit PhnH